MKSTIFDPFLGASGDMIVAALIDLGAPVEPVKNSMERVANVRVEVKKVKKCGVSATKVHVKSNLDQSRFYIDVIEIIDKSDLGDRVARDVLAIFEIIADAESNVHGVQKDELIFHELGSGDAIADVVGACVAFHELGLNESTISSTPVSVGGGFVDTKHGRLPVPAPATMHILSKSGLISRGGPFHEELLTPTGAAILSHFVEDYDQFLPSVRIKKVGYGAGELDLELPNVLRIVSGEVEDALLREEIDVVETDVDDVTGEVLGDLIAELMDAGAKDVCIVPAMMKKGRSGHIIQAITKPIDSQRIARKIMEETGSIGIRILPIKHRLIAVREKRSVRVDIKGIKRKVDVKIATDTNGNLLNIAAEFDEAKKIARELDVPVRETMRMAEEVARREWNEEHGKIS
jgi:hypothetical protein